MINWDPPVKPNGVITKYQLQCTGGEKVFSINATGSQTTTTLSGLLPYTNYSCSITAHTSVGGGPAATTSVTTEQDGNHKNTLCMLLLCSHTSIQLPKDLLRISHSLLILVLSSSLGILPSSYNVMESSSAISLLAIVAVDLETSVTLILLLKNWSHSPTTLVPLVLQQLKEMVL